MNDNNKERRFNKKSGWRLLLESCLRILLATAVASALILFVTLGYTIEGWDWTGFPAEGDKGPKRLWDWLELIIIPAVLAFGAIGFRAAQAKAERQRAEDNEELQRDLEEQRAQEAALESYLDRMSTLLLESKLLSSKPGDTVRDLARARTIAALRRLHDASRRNHVLGFLRDANLLADGLQSAYQAEKTIVRSYVLGFLSEENLLAEEVDNSQDNGKKTEELESAQPKNRTIAALEGGDLRGIDLSRAELWLADLHEAKLLESNLSSADLSGADLTGANLTSADLRGADLSQASLLNARLGGANLRGANLREAVLGIYHREIVEAMSEMGPNLVKLASWKRLRLRLPYLRGADLREANLRGAVLGLWADLRGADLRGADLRDADVRETFLNKADLRGSDLRGSDLSRAHLSNADLSGMNLGSGPRRGARLRFVADTGVKLREADLSNAKLRKANLTNADLHGANLRGSDLRGADLSNAKLRAANIRDADLRGAKNLSDKQLRQAKQWRQAYRDPELACGADIPEPPPEEHDT